MSNTQKPYKSPHKAVKLRKILLDWAIDHKVCPNCLEEQLMRVRTIRHLRLVTVKMSHKRDPKCEFYYGGRHYRTCTEHSKIPNVNFTILLK